MNCLNSCFTSQQKIWKDIFEKLNYETCKNDSKWRQRCRSCGFYYNRKAFTKDKYLKCCYQFGKFWEKKKGVQDL